MSDLGGSSNGTGDIEVLSAPVDPSCPDGDCGGTGGGSGGGATPPTPPCIVRCPDPRPGRAFPEAEGFGAKARGGRGGRVVYVTNLEDYNTDAGDPVIEHSLRWAVEEVHEPRFVLFAVGGTIPLKKSLRIQGEAASFITIAGQTAPGEGIQLTRFGLLVCSGAHDVIVRHLRIRPGYTADSEWDKDAVEIAGNSGPVRDVIIDHCSLEWAIDENVSVYNLVERVTLQYCILGEGSSFGHHGHDAEPGVSPNYNHSMAMLVGATPGVNVTSDEYLTLHHNLFISNLTRNPQIQNIAGVVECVNNLFYNWGSYATVVVSDPTYTTLCPRVNIRGNHYVRGPETYLYRHPVSVNGAIQDATLYVHDNIGPYREDASLDDWRVVTDATVNNPFGEIVYNVATRRFEPWPGGEIPVAAEPASAIRTSLPPQVGANYPRLDAVDAGLIQDLENGTGQIGFGTSPDDHEPYPVLANGPAPLDSDEDGMPDAWELSQGLDPTDPTDGTADPDGDGYTNVEEYLNNLVAAS